MPTLNWIGKSAVVEHHKDVPFHLLRSNPELSVGDASSGNMLIQGDNLIALKALLPYYAGKVKCIYIDPPYNTGEERWVYNDSVNSPEMQDWLGKVVGGEAEDLSRHDKWLCMLYPRLILLHKFLRDDGSFWMSIDDNEIHDARMLLDDIFGRNNFLATIVWQKRTSPDARLSIGPAHDYVLVYAKNLERTKKEINRIPLSVVRTSEYKNPDNDPRGPWASRDITGQTGHATENQFYELRTPSGKKYRPPTGRCWTVSEDTFNKLVGDNRIWFGKNGSSRPRMKLFLSESNGSTAWTWWSNSEVGHNQEATKEIKEIFGEGAIFETPKPTRLIERIIKLTMNQNDLMLDSFAGSGTTGHAIFKVNKEDNGNRHFILVEIESDIARGITAERLKRVIQGYTWRDQKGNDRLVEGLGGGFQFCKLGPTLFDSQGRIREEISFPELAQYVFFSETGEPMSNPVPESPFLGVSKGVGVYLLYNGILKDKTPQGGNVLTRAVLNTLPAHAGSKVIYGTGCLLSPQTLQQLGITFRQIPYELKAS